MNKSEKIIKHVKYVAHLLGGEYNLSRSGVPRILFHNEKCSASLVYVAHDNQWKIFYPYPSIEQERIYFSKNKDMVDWLYERGFIKDVAPK